MSKVFNVGLCAYGMSGKLFHAPFLHLHHGFHLYAVVERSNKVAKSKYPHIISYDRVEEMLADPNIDLVIVNTPIQLHYTHALWAIEAGKNVVIEKPFCVDTSEASNLIKAAEIHNVHITVFQNRRWDKDFVQVKKVIHSQSLGKLHEVEIRFDRFRLTPSGKSHKEGNLPGAGTLYDLGAHLIDQALQLFGTPTSIFASLATIKDGIDADDYFETILFYPDKLQVRIVSNPAVKKASFAYALYGTEGTFFQNRSDQQEAMLAQQITPDDPRYMNMDSTADGFYYGPLHESIHPVMIAPPCNYMLFFDALYLFYTNKGPNPVTAQEGYMVIHTINKAMESNATSKKVEL